MLTFCNILRSSHTSMDTIKVLRVGIANGPVWVPSNAFQFVLIGKFLNGDFSNLST